MNDKLQRQRDRLDKAQERLAITVQKEKEKERVQLSNRLAKLGVAAEQLMRDGDLTLLSRLESLVKSQFEKQPAARIAFGFDQVFSYFDKLREEIMIAKGNATAATAPKATPDGEASKAPPALGATAKAPSPQPRAPQSNASNGAQSAAPSAGPTASA